MDVKFYKTQKNKMIKLLKLLLFFFYAKQFFSIMNEL